MNELQPAAAGRAKPRLGFIGWGPESAALWDILRAGPGVGATPPLFMPGNRPAEGPLQALPTLEALFGACETIFVEAPAPEMEQIMPQIRLSITDRHVLVLMGRGWSMEAVWRHLNERKLVRCLVSFPGAAPATTQGETPAKTPGDAGGGRTLLAFHAAPFLEPEEVAAFRELFGSLELVLELEDEVQFQVMQSLAGIAPAAFYTIMDAMADGALMMGLPRPAALRFIASLLLNTAESMLEGDRHPALLREEALRSNTAAAGLMELESAGLRGMMMRAVRQAMEQLDPAGKED